MPRRSQIPFLALALAAASVACHESHLNFDRTDGQILIHDDLYSVSVVDDDTAVAVGYYGAAYWTDDGGATWKAGTTKTLKSLYNVSMADAQRGWAVGQRGLILRTEDGGRTWQRQPNLKETEGVHLFGVTARDANTAWAVGEWGTRIITTDGGKTWEDQSFFVDELHPMFVWLAPFEKDKVRNGQRVYEDVGLNDVSCLPKPSQKCWLVGEFGYVYYSDDAGATWKPANIEGSAVMDPIRVEYDAIEISLEDEERLKQFSDHIRDEAHLNVAIEAVASAREIESFGRGEDPEALFEILEARTAAVREVLEDIGLPPERIRLRAQPPWDYEDYLDDDPEFLERFLVGRTHEHPGIKIRVIQNPVLFSIRFSDEKNGMVAGLGGVILVSSDGGHNWRYRQLDRKQAVFSVANVGSRAIAVGEKGLIRSSVDSERASWVEPGRDVFPEIHTYMRDVGFAPSGKMGLIVGQEGQVLRSSDEGFSWVQVLPEAEPEAEHGAG